MQDDYAPLRTLRDVEELERVPLEQRIFSWNLNDWIAQGCTRDPGKIAIRYVADGDPDGEAVGLTYRRAASAREPDRQPVPFARRVARTTSSCCCCRRCRSSSS